MATTGRSTMTPLDRLWESLIGDGVPFTSQRIDAEHQLDLFASVGTDLALGLVLICDDEPPPSPGLDAVEITLTQRADRRWVLGIWLQRPDLREVFRELCEDLVESSRAVAPADGAVFLLSRIERWRRLLELGKGLLSVSEIRGLIAELIILQRAMEFWPAQEVVAGWLGPLEAPQDVVLPGLLIEVKAGVPSSRTVRISSLEQLDVDDRALLGVVTLASTTGGPESINLPDVIAATARLVGAKGLAADVGQFHRRLSATRYRPDPAYDKLLFKIQDVQYFAVTEEFPRIRRRDVPAGVRGGSYDVLLTSISGLRTDLQR